MADKYQISNQCLNGTLFVFYFPPSFICLPPSLPSSFFLPFISSLRRIANHVSLVTTAMLWGSQHLQENAGKASSVWRVLIVLTLL